MKWWPVAVAATARAMRGEAGRGSAAPSAITSPYHRRNRHRPPLHPPPAPKSTGHLESRSGHPGTGSELTWPGPAAPAVAAVAVKRGGGERAEEKESPPPSPAPARAPAGAAIAATALPAELHAAHARGGAVGLLPHAPPRERRKAPPPPSLLAGRPCRRPAPAAAQRGEGRGGAARVWGEEPPEPLAWERRGGTTQG